MQNLGARDGDYNRAKFFQKDPDSSALVETMTDAEINALTRGGHDFRKLYAAFSAARAHRRAPDGDPGQDQEGFWDGRGRQVSHDRSPVQEARHRGPPGVSRSVRPAAQGTRTWPRSRSIGRRPTVPKCATSRPAGRRSAAFFRRGGVERWRRRPFRRSGLTRALRPPRAERRCVDHDGGRAHPQRPPEGPGDRPAHRSDRRR